MRAVTFVLPDEMADVSIAGLQWIIVIPRLNHTRSHRPIESHSIPYLHREKNIGFGIRQTDRNVAPDLYNVHRHITKLFSYIRTTQPVAILQITRKAAIRL